MKNKLLSFNFSQHRKIDKYFSYKMNYFNIKINNIKMNDDLKDTFDGYLNFDFSNFHHMMAEAFENDEDDPPEEIKIKN